MTNNDSDVKIILSRIKTIFNVEKDADLARAMGISPQTLSSWRQRSAIPYTLCVECAKTKGASIDWLIYGEGPMMRQQGKDAELLNASPAEGDPSLRMQIYHLLKTLPREDLEDILSEATKRQRLRALEQRFETLHAQFFEPENNQSSASDKKTA